MIATNALSPQTSIHTGPGTGDCNQRSISTDLYTHRWGNHTGLCKAEMCWCMTRQTLKHTLCAEKTRGFKSPTTEANRCRWFLEQEINRRGVFLAPGVLFEFMFLNWGPSRRVSFACIYAFACVCAFHNAHMIYFPTVAMWLSARESRCTYIREQTLFSIQYVSLLID